MGAREMGLFSGEAACWLRQGWEMVGTSRSANQGPAGGNGGSVSGLVPGGKGIRSLTHTTCREGQGACGGPFLEHQVSDFLTYTML